MALSNIEMIRLITQDNGRLPVFEEGFHILTDDEIDGYLTMCNGDVLQAARWATRSVMYYISSFNTKEVFGDVEMWSDFGKNYIKAAQSFLDDKTLFSVLPTGIMPWAAGVSVESLIASAADPDNPNITNWLYQDKKGCEYAFPYILSVD